MGAIAIAAFEHRVGLAVADHGLKDHQRAELDRCGVSWITHERPGLEIADVKHPIVCDVKAWWKPWVCQASPFNRSVWVDSDAVVVGDTHELFESCGFGIATQGLWNIEENQLYAKLVDSIFGEDGVPHLQQVRKINTGILCWSSGDPIIQDWLHWCDKLIHDTTLIKLCNVRDQSGMLVTLVNRLINNDPLPVMLGDEYNTPANYLPAKESHKREPISLNPARMMRDTILKHRDAKIVHWLGLPKPWDTKVSHAK
jgi:hypothetical protein